MTKPMIALSLIFGMWMLQACDGGGDPSLPDPGPDAGLDPAQGVKGSSTAELATICDWTAGRLGGYGRSTMCGDISIHSPPGGQAACLMAFEQMPVTCAVTFGQYEDCVNAAVMGPCVSGVFPAPCVPLLSCAML